MLLDESRRRMNGAIDRTEARFVKSLSDLRGLTDDELRAQHDQVIKGGGMIASPDYYLRELARRESARQTETMVKLTWAIFGLTAVNVIVVIVALLS